MSALTSLLYSQFFVTPPYPDTDFTSQTIVVTGSNVGLGLEAARHFVRLNAEKVILAVRTVSKGEAAKASIEQSTKRPSGVVEVWPLDLSSYESVKYFAQRLQGLKRLDALVENAGIMNPDFGLLEDNESVITVNVVSTFLLAVLALPKLRETASRFDVTPRLTIVSSIAHFLTTFPERNSENIFAKLNDKATANMGDRYNVSKLMEVFTVRELSDLTTAKSGSPQVVINAVNPGLCHSDLGRTLTGLDSYVFAFEKALMARTIEVGSRTLVHAGGAGPESHGQYMSDCKVKAVAPLVLSASGAETQKKLWAELSQKLEAIQPGILDNI